MDHGNHYKKCDLQVHSPRDLGWKGKACHTEEDRKEYAKNFVKECREAGLDAVAITDHHDMVFFEYIKSAAKEELDDNGILIPEHRRLVVFPGIELTLHQPPMQGLLILDADFPETLFPTVLGSLSLAQAPKDNEKTNQTKAIPSDTINSINEIYKKLDSTHGVKGRYIFFPHVKDGGHKTLMREGFHEAYAKMPCVGGYVDGKFEGGSVGYTKIISGEVDAWGFKSIAVLQTSDYRSEKPIKDYAAAAWIKWKEPTAEALRQACLAKESRISLNEPELPNIYIEKIDVTNSVFLSKFSLDFNPQLNSIIGGRGSGKSTILEYLRWALCDQTGSFGNDDEKSEIARKRSSLIEKTLKAVSGEVRIFFMVNGTRHIVKRNPSAEDVLLKIGDEEFQSVRPKQIEDLLPIQAYSQKQLSSVSMKSDELRRFIEQPISEEIEDIESKISSASKDVKSSYEKLSQYRALRSELNKNEVEINSFKKQVEQLRSGLKGVSDEDRKTLERVKCYVNEKNRFDEVDIEYSSILAGIRSLKDTVDGYIRAGESDVTYENIKILESLGTERRGHLMALSKSVGELINTHSESHSKIESIREQWKVVRDEFEKKYKEAKEKSSSSKTTLTAIKDLEEKIEKLELLVRQKRSKISGSEVTENDFVSTYEHFIKLQEEKTEKLKSSTALFTELSDGLIEADFKKSIDAEKLAEEINKTFSAFSLNIQKPKGIKLAEDVSISDRPVNRWCSIMLEMKSLSEFNLLPDAKDELPHTPILDSAGFTPANKRKISESMSSEGFLILATIELEFLPVFYYLTHNEMGDKIPFEDSSAGQQATALLNVLLNQDGFPLIIDQPEDDIDNRAIEKIIHNIWSSKKKRQIIISSHNANIVVNGDSELVVCCDYNETSEQTKGHIKYEGSIDSENIRNEITSVMEGGEKAFRLRKEKYGF